MNDDLPYAVRAYRDNLPPGRLVQFPLSGIDRLNLPFWLVTFYQQGGPTNAGSGYGVADGEALIGAYGELTEVVSAHQAMQRVQPESASYRDMLRVYGEHSVIDPLTLCLHAGSDYTPFHVLQWVPVTRYPSGDTAFIPIEFVACQTSDVGHGPWLVTLITNGLGAGLSREQALAHALLELVQRDGNSVSFRALAGTTAVNIDGVADTEVRRLREQLASQGVEVVVKLASTDFGMANLYVVGIDRSEGERTIPLMALACGEAAHPNRERALRKALLEFMAARARVAFSHGPLGPIQAVAPPGYLDEYLARYNSSGEEQRALAAMLELAPKSLHDMRAVLGDVLAANTTIALDALPTSPVPRDPHALAALVTERLQAAGCEILVADYTAPGAEVCALKAIVPGLEVETMSYHRIGERNLRRLLDRNSPLVGIGAPPPGAARVPLTEAAEARLGGPAYFDIAAAEQLVGPRYALYREPGRHATGLIRAGRVRNPLS
jgi:thiazole/oxazole-forming peptide maturase SagD family component